MLLDECNKDTSAVSITVKKQNRGILENLKTDTEVFLMSLTVLE